MLRIVDDVIDVATNNINEVCDISVGLLLLTLSQVLHWDELRLRPDFQVICNTAQLIVEKKKQWAESMLPQVSYLRTVGF